MVSPTRFVKLTKPMDRLRESYLEFCKSFYVEPNEIVLGEIEKLHDEKNEKKSFNLSSLHVPESQCSVLGKLFAHDYLISRIFFNDCNLSGEGLELLMNGLLTNTTCEKLELKGNRIHGRGVEAIAKVLRKNQTLKKLRLEWNQLGSMDSAVFTSFCDALAMNKALVELDLRNNDISHVGGTELAAALKRNVTLTTLDLRWNNIGMIGGRALLAACQSNSTLNELHLVGNDIPDDVLQMIAHALAKNNEKRQMHFGHSHEMAVLARHLQNAQTNKDRQVTSLLQRVTIQEQAMLKANKSLADKVKKLQHSLEDRRLAFNAVSAKNALLEADLTVANQQFHDAQTHVKKLQMENEQLIERLQREHKQEKDDLFHHQEKLQRELNESLENHRRSTNKIHDLERRNEALQATIHELKENLVHNDREHHVKLAAFDDENQRLKLKHKEEMKDAELIHTREIQRLNESHLTSEQTLKDQVNKLETIRTSLEREINTLKSTLSTQKLNFDESLQQEKLRMKNQEEQSRHELEQRLRNLTTTKDELESRLNQLNSTNRELQQRIQFQTSESETLKRQIESLQLIVHSKDTEILEIREKLKTDYEKKLTHIQKEIDLNEELKDKIKQLQRDHKDQQFQDRNTIRDLETKNADLQAKLQQREQELLQFKQQEEKRLNFLRTAMLDYVNRGTRSAELA